MVHTNSGTAVQCLNKVTDKTVTVKFKANGFNFKIDLPRQKLTDWVYAQKIEQRVIKSRRNER